MPDEETPPPPMAANVSRRPWFRAELTVPAGAAIGFLILRLGNGLIWTWGVSMNNPIEGWHRLEAWVADQSRYAEIPIYKGFLDRIVIPNLGLFKWLQFLTESFLAFSLLAGFLTRLGGLVAFLWTANLIVASYPIPHEPLYLFALWAAAPLAIAFLAPGRVLGLDAVLRGRWATHKNALPRWLARWCM